MSKVKVVKQDCGCEIVYEPISRSLFIRERWGKLCTAHDAEWQAYRAEARRGHDARKHEQAVREEFA